MVDLPVWTRVGSDRIRVASCSAAISKHKKATGAPSAPSVSKYFLAALKAMLVTSAVLPIEGRPARMIRSDECMPPSMRSMSFRPVVAFFAGRSSSTWPRIEAAGSFCVNILAEDQEGICRRFASKEDDKFAGIAWQHAGSGSALLGG